MAETGRTKCWFFQGLLFKAKAERANITVQSVTWAASPSDEPTSTPEASIAPYTKWSSSHAWLVLQCWNARKDSKIIVVILICLSMWMISFLLIIKVLFVCFLVHFLTWKFDTINMSHLWLTILFSKSCFVVKFLAFVKCFLHFAFVWLLLDTVI